MYFLLWQILPLQVRIALMWLFLDMFFVFGQIVPQQVCIALMWVLSRYVLSAGADFTPTSAYCFNVAV